MARIKQILIDQKEELKNLFESKKVVERENMGQFREISKSKLIKVITGVRRSGKSFLTYQLVKDKRYGYVNFDDDLLMDANASQLLQHLHEIYGEIDVLFLDEVQNHQKWEMLVSTLYRRGYDLFVTGSNAKLLSRELASMLTGRHVALEIFPFSFREFARAKKAEITGPLSSSEKGKILRLLEEYIQNGGFPEVVVENENPKIYLKALFDQIIKRDVLIRYKIRYAKSFQEMAMVLLSNPSSYTTLSKLKKLFKFGSEHTVKNYLCYLEETYLIFFIPRFSYKPKEIELGERKIYIIDTSLVTHVSYNTSENYGPLMENLVAIELLRKKPGEIYYYKTPQGYEVDFLIKEGSKVKELIQVTYANSREEIEEREIRALLHAKKNLRLSKDVPLTIITWDYEDVKEERKHGMYGKIRFIPLWKWLLEVK